MCARACARVPMCVCVCGVCECMLCPAYASACACVLRMGARIRMCMNLSTAYCNEIMLYWLLGLNLR